MFAMGKAIRYMRPRKRAVEVVLPTVRPPDLYLMAMVFLRGIEKNMRGHPSLAAPAEAAGAPFVGDEVAEFIWATLIPQIHRQALAAKGDGGQFLTPRVRGRPLLLAQAAALLERWSERLGTGWNDQALGTTLIEALGLPAPPATSGLSSPGSPSSSGPRRPPESLDVRVRGPGGQWRRASLSLTARPSRSTCSYGQGWPSISRGKGETCPLILDDPTAQWDPQRTEASPRVLHAIRRERQVVVFSQEADVLAWAQVNLHEPQDHLERLEVVAPV